MMNADPRFSSDRSDRELGMDRRITRRDFLDGMALAVGATAAGGLLAGTGTAHAAGRPGDYPPALTGLRGSHAGSFETAHALRDGTFDVGEVRDTGEEYDLVVVGAGISGLSAAHFYLRDVDPRARILIIDPHDDFGGHAKRNEFRVGGRTLIGYGGSQSIDTPSAYPEEAKRLLLDVGIEVDRFETYYDREFNQRHGLVNRATYFLKETWGRDHLALRRPGMTNAQLLADAPLAPDARRQLAELLDSPRDWLTGLDQEQKLAELRKRTVMQFMDDYVGLLPDTRKYLIRSIAGGTGLNMDQFPALDGAARGYTGVNGLGLDRSGGPWPGLGKTSTRFWGHDDPYIHHFPDGNAGVARALVRRLVPGAIPGGTMEDLVTARCDYSRLDQGRNRVRIRLNSTAVRVAHRGRPDRARWIDVLYARDGKVHRARARSVVMACWNAMIPYIAPDFSPEQRAAGREAVKYPLLYVNIALTNWRAWQRLGVANIGFPAGFWSSMSLDMPVSMGTYRFSSGPDEPIVVHAGACLTQPGMTAQAGAKAGRGELTGISFRDFERSLRDSLARALGPSGFDPASDIAAITVNRWAHGYARYYRLPADEAFWPQGPTPADILSEGVGRIMVSTTDAAYHGFVDGAIETAYRAVHRIAERL
ncbi:NAD(P)/FAD-dependent oxidoreductase [Nonomuraea aridisoli]|uniref:FAD-dependent oxidoreductase n=1 Tax=Nonomuraea aridisoli TaxID=2070368 RepID=A0A2W2G4R9_9ACTN|nr:NAD(P)/FAD-dependent oxidoreductase [Nonomuraea aridisoli]PZG21874.1 FAD-dependent oxidoreductase [Nonomuraea aridisoli]